LDRASARDAAIAASRVATASIHRIAYLTDKGRIPAQESDALASMSGHLLMRHGNYEERSLVEGIVDRERRTVSGIGAKQP
jgi:hypothetical protein